jgi:predicted MFS family arabinose efflux permease
MFIVVAVEYMNAISPINLRATGQALFWASYNGAGVFAGNLWTGFWYEKINIQYAILIDACILAALILLPFVMMKQKLHHAEAEIKNIVIAESNKELI